MLCIVSIWDVISLKEVTKQWFCVSIYCPFWCLLVCFGKQSPMKLLTHLQKSGLSLMASPNYLPKTL